MKCQITVDGRQQEVDVVDVEYKTLKEPWAEYECLDNGDILRVKLVVSSVLRQTNGEGYFVNTGSVVGVRRKEK